MKKKEKEKKKEAVAPEAEKITLPLEEKSNLLLQSAENTSRDLNSFYPDLLENDWTEEAGRVADSLKRATVNINKAGKIANVMQDELRARAKDIKRQRKGKGILATPSNSKVDYQESQSDSFVKGINIYKLLLLCFIGSFCGVVIESIWFFLRNGYLQSRAGLIYGPFNLLYGVGAVVLTLSLYKFRNRGMWLSFIGGAIVGSVVEYVCSWLQEVLLGSRSWDYSNVPFNINGRICLLYSVFWGILGVLWIKGLYPVIASLMLKIPNKVGKIITWILTAFFIINIVMSCLSVGRWSMRNRGIPPSNDFWEFIDERFPDERMHKVYASMEFSE